MIKWAGWIFTFLGTGHTVLGIALFAAPHAAAWLGGGLWGPGEPLDEMSPTMGAFWLTVGSFGVPLLVMGLTILWIHRSGLVPPAFIGWVLGVWSLVAALIMEPAPWILGPIAAVLYLVGVRRAEDAARTAQAAEAAA
jgi:hypothetical protein